MSHFASRSDFNVAKRFYVLMFVLCMAFLPHPLWAQKGTIKIAVQAPLSGEQAALGEHIKLGAQLAVEESARLSSLSATIWCWFR